MLKSACRASSRNWSTTQSLRSALGRHVEVHVEFPQRRIGSRAPIRAATQGNGQTRPSVPRAPVHLARGLRKALKPHAHCQTTLAAQRPKPSPRCHTVLFPRPPRHAACAPASFQPARPASPLRAEFRVDRCGPVLAICLRCLRKWRVEGRVCLAGATYNAAYVPTTRHKNFCHIGAP